MLSRTYLLQVVAKKENRTQFLLQLVNFRFLTYISIKRCVFMLFAGYRANDRLFDDQEFRSEVFQRPFYYLYCMETKQQPTAFEFSFNHGDQKDCLSTLLRSVAD